MSRLGWLTSVSCCLAFVMTSLMVTSRLCLLWLLRLYKYEQIHPVTWYAVVLLLLVAPHMTHLVYIVWTTPILSPANRPKAPVCWNIVLGILSSVIEGVAMSVFATEVAPVLPEPVLLTLPYAVVASTAITNVFFADINNMGKMKHDDPMPDWSPKLASLGLGIYLFFAPTATGILLHTESHFRVDVKELCGLVISVLLLSGVWNPLIQKASLMSQSSNEKCPMIEIFYAIFRTMSSTVALCLSVYCKYGEMRNDAVAFLANACGEWSNTFIIVPTVLCLLSGILGIMTVSASSKLGLVTAGMKVPFFLSPFLVIGFTIAMWHDIQTDAIWELSGDDLASWSTIVLSIAIWVIPFFFPALKLMKSPVKNGRSFKDNFVSFSWNVFFFEPRVVLNYESISDTDATHVPGSNQDKDRVKSFGKSDGKTSTIFLCTTMYKESEREMERYVDSVKDTFDNINDHMLKIEAHVLFDGAVENGKLNIKSRQLISLICDSFQLKYQQLVSHSTPYGCQMHSGKHLRHKIFIHFKDTSLVKNKKRWSQVMYLNYILQFRCGHRNDLETKIHKRVNDPEGFEIWNENRPVEMKNSDQIHGSGKRSYTLSDMEVVQMQAEFARLRRKVTGIGNVEGISYTKTATGLVETVMRRHDQNQCQADEFEKKLGSHSQCAFVNSGTQSFNVEDRLIRTSSKDSSWKNHDTSSKNDRHKMKNHSSSKNSISSELSCNTQESPGPNPTSTRTHTNKTTKTLCLEDVFILATDADTAFNAKSVLEVLTQCENSPSLGAVCGRTEPIGSSKPIVWYQKFEYAKDFWLVKASQNVIGSVTCCPGCFSLYRGSALADVFREFSLPTTSGFDSLVKDHGEDRWLCTLLMQKGWRLAYSAHAQNSTHCPETVGEFLRQRRRWLLSEVSNMLSIFLSIPQLVRYNSSFSAMFLISLFMTFLWIILSPSTTLVFLCAGGDVLFSVPLTFTLPFASMLFLVYLLVCCFLSQSRQKLASLVITVSIATVTLMLSVGFVLYVVSAMQKDLNMLGSIQFRPYFLVFLLILATVYAAVLHPRESLSLAYGLCYGLLFPTIFVVLPVYSLTNMVDQSWGTREPGTHSCCQSPEEEMDEKGYDDFQINTTGLPSLIKDPGTWEENQYWESLRAKVIGRNIHIGKTDADVISSGLNKLRRTSVILLLVANCLWFVFLSVLYVYAGSDSICYCVASVFSFSLVLQLVGLTCYRIHSLIDRYLLTHDVHKIHTHDVHKMNFELRP